MTKPLVLFILDGVGIAPASPHNPVTPENMPFFYGLLEKYPNTQLDASGTAVGLLPGTIGNSEDGHITIGSGRIVNRFLRRFQIEDESGRIPTNPRLLKFIDQVKQSGGIVHSLGITSDGRVHNDIAQAIKIWRIILNAGLKICIHFVSDGRDTPPRHAMAYADLLLATFADEIAAGRLWFGTLSGRYYPMDRDKNYDRNQLAFDAIVSGKSEWAAPDIKSAITDAYARGESDEFIKPTVISADGKPTRMTNRDGLLFTDYRADRARQILKFIAMPDMPAAKRPENYAAPHVLCFGQYGDGLDEICPALLEDVAEKNTFGDIIAAAGLSQLRIAETEKYIYVTFCFDAERTIDYPNEEKIKIPSPKVATFDLKPEMAAAEITDALIPRLSEFDVVILNYANGDMVGHTGNEAATARALGTLDSQLARLVPAVLALDGAILITADHGDAEKMWNDELNVPWTAHTANPVPFIVVSGGLFGGATLSPKSPAKGGFGTNPPHLRSGGGLADIAPTMLKILNIPQPAEMTGESLI